jgi:hypothetical protein
MLTGRVLLHKIIEEVRNVLGCDLPFDSSHGLDMIGDGNTVDAHVDFGLCPWHTCSGKTDMGDASGRDTSKLGRLYHRLDHSIQSSMSYFH